MKIYEKTTFAETSETLAELQYLIKEHHTVRDYAEIVGNELHINPMEIEMIIISENPSAITSETKMVDII